MEALRSLCLFFFVIAVVALEATISHDYKVGAKLEENVKKKQKGEKRGIKRNQVRGQCPKVKGRLNVIVRC